MDTSDEALRQQLNLETGRIAWPELQRHFARGIVIDVAPHMDLVEVAIKFVQDDKTTIEAWISSGSIGHATDEDAKTWMEVNAVFWAIVVAPWVLIQEEK